ncbi:transient receptor potential cation channel subfamily M member 3-like isoform X2 [Acanthaster planci]|uniref:Transient receptor potential cation channel subfamily M member 3-like isoform X2 n=1 Tax=Acanthaster planci TaxID=133434 RepID=A0A8B7Y305_ACAPL|nr:transient receptor potential cation channel subfamily M member 3-like isoform X2 [Acanthaster planci]
MTAPTEEFRTERSVSIIQEDLKVRSGHEMIRETFKKVECIRFVPSTKSQGVCLCGRVFEHHIPECVEGEPGEIWDPDDGRYTRRSPTDAFGEVEFQGVWTSTRAKYVRVAHDTQASDILDLLTNIWNLPLPKLLIEVTGGAKDFVLQPKLRRVFRKGIVKVAESTDAWILTGGTNTGVMKHVGKALREHTLRSRHKINAIGVVSWGIVDGNTELEDKRNRQHARVKHYRMTSSLESSGASLDPNHTHFILVDNGTVGKYGVEITLRSSLEKLVSNHKMDPASDCGIPAVCLVLEGGLNTIRVVLENITKDPIIPVVIAEGSGRGADLIAYAYAKSDAEGALMPDHKEKLKAKIAQTFPSNQDKHESLFEDLEQVMKRKNLITIYSVDAGDDVDIDYAILNALMKASNLSPSDQLKLSLIWNRVDLAKEKIFNQNISWNDLCLDEAMEVALVRNRVDFVRLLLEAGCYMKSFVTTKRLEQLYSSIDSMDESEPFPTLSVLYQQANLMPPKIRYGKRHFRLQLIGRLIQYLLGKGFACNYTASSENNLRCKTCGTFMKCFQRTEGEESDSCSSSADFDCFPFNDLFLWALLTKKYQIARLMWQRGRETLAKALIGARLCYRMSEVAKWKYNTDAADRLAEEKRWYENLAVELLSQCFEEDASFTRLLLCAQLDNWSEQTCLSLAAAFNHSRFIAHPSIQFLLNDQWYGVFSKISSVKEFTEWLFPAKASNSTDEQLSIQHSNKNSIRCTSAVTSGYEMQKTANGERKHSIHSVGSLGLGIRGPTFKRRLPYCTYGSTTDDQNEAPFLEKIRLLMVAPIGKFWINTLFYFIFLMMFSFVVLVDLQGDIMVVEWVVTCTVFTLAMEELRQVLMMGEHGRLTLWQKIKMWASDKWNVWDLVGILLYIPGFILRLCSVSNMDCAGQPFARMFFCLDVMVWYVRLLDVCSVNNVMGPYVNMIGNMIRDLLYFMLILLVFLVSYGVARQAILYPRSEWEWKILADIFLIPYWQVYGELFPDAENNQDTYNVTAEPQAEINEWDRVIVIGIMSVYLMISNVLLLNLLIAIFNNTFTRVHDNASEIWKFQRYRLIMEYSEKPFLPAPFTIIIHVIMVIKRLMYSCCGHTFNLPDMKEILDEPSMQLLYNFEEECTENYLRQKALEEQSSVNGTIQRISEKVDTYSTFQEEQQQRDFKYSESIRRLTERVDNMERSIESVMQLMSNEKEPDDKKGLGGKVTSMSPIAV